MPINYLQLYTNAGNALNDDYTRLYVPHHPTNGNTDDNLLHTAVLSSQRIPKVYLANGTLDNNRHCIIVIHCPSSFEQDILEPSHTWDDKNFVFSGDVTPDGSNFIRVHLFPDNAFTPTDPQHVPTLDAVSALFAAALSDFIGPFDATDVNIEVIQTRNLVPVPFRYLPLVLNKDSFTLRELREQLGMAIITDSHQLDCAHLLDWIRVAITVRHTVPASAQHCQPATHLGSLATALPPIADNTRTAQHHWSILRRNFPALTQPTNASTPAQLAHLYGVIRQEHAATLAANEARQLAEKQDKLPSATKYKTVALDWVQFTGVPDNFSLPPLYHQLVISDKADHLNIIRAAVRKRARHPSAAPMHGAIPVISKETKEMIMMCQFGVPAHELKNLTLGLQPFGVGFFLGDELGCTVDSRATNYSLMLLGQTAPTLGKQATFNTWEVPVPQDPFTAGIMLATTSILVDVIQGLAHPFATRFRHFCVTKWPTIATTLNMAGRLNPKIWNVVIPCIMRWIQMRMVSSFHQSMIPASYASIPQFHDLHQLITLQTFNLLPDLPHAYRVAPKSGSPPSLRLTYPDQIMSLGTWTRKSKLCTPHPILI